MRELTDRQQEILEFLRDFQDRNGYSPSQTEIAAHFRMYLRGVQGHLHALKEKGWLRWTPARRRSLELTDRRRGRPRRIPILGRIAAGRPLLAEENWEGETVIDGERFRAAAYFAVRVQGDSMVEACIQDGDLAIIRPQTQVDQGAIAAVAVEGAVTLKRFYRRRHGVELRPAHARYRPIVLTEGDVRILGLYCGLIRGGH